MRDACEGSLPEDEEADSVEFVGYHCPRPLRAVSFGSLRVRGSRSRVDMLEDAGRASPTSVLRCPAMGSPEEVSDVAQSRTLSSLLRPGPSLGVSSPLRLRRSEQPPRCSTRSTPAGSSPEHHALDSATRIHGQVLDCVVMSPKPIGAIGTSAAAWICERTASRCVSTAGTRPLGDGAAVSDRVRTRCVSRSYPRQSVRTRPMLAVNRGSGLHGDVRRSSHTRSACDRVGIAARKRGE